MGLLIHREFENIHSLQWLEKCYNSINKHYLYSNHLANNTIDLFEINKHNKLFKNTSNKHLLKILQNLLNRASWVLFYKVRKIVFSYLLQKT